jgi:hypothetical protein
MELTYIRKRSLSNYYNISRYRNFKEFQQWYVRQKEKFSLPKGEGGVRVRGEIRDMPCVARRILG